ncbi:MAG TPA: dihydrofolate reductase family protein [Acidimicrobiales bacterium]
MDALLPVPERDVDPIALYAADDRPAPAARPWVLANMIATADGSAVDAAGRSGGIGGPADRAVFFALRGVADVILAGAATVVAEDYGPARPPPAIRRMRRERGQPEAPRIAVVTASLGIDPGRRLFRDAADDRRPIVLTVEGADPARRRALAAVADVHDAGVDRVEWHRALSVLAEVTGARSVLCEGGPTTIGQLVADDLIDELCLTIAPSLVAGTGSRIAHGPIATDRRLALDRVLAADGHLFLRYLRDRAGG